MSSTAEVNCPMARSVVVMANARYEPIMIMVLSYLSDNAPPRIDVTLPMAIMTPVKMPAQTTFSPYASVRKRGMKFWTFPRDRIEMPSTRISSGVVKLNLLSDGVGSEEAGLGCCVTCASSFTNFQNKRMMQSPTAGMI